MQETISVPLPVEGVADVCRGLAHEKRVRMLAFLTKPRYLEEIATELGVARQTAEKHAQQLVELGLVRRQAGIRASGGVVEYVLVPQKLFAASEAVLEIGARVCRARGEPAPVFPTQPAKPAPAVTAGNGVPRLLLVHGRGVGRTFSLPASGGSFVLGRDPEAAICLDYDSFASYRHAEIARGPRGLEIMDALSTNGTHVNGRRLVRGERTALRHGDVVTVGRSILLFQNDG